MCDMETNTANFIKVLRIRNKARQIKVGNAVAFEYRGFRAYDLNTLTAIVIKGSK